MIIEQLFPSKSPTMTEGTLVSWRIKPGDKVTAGQVIAEVGTDKAVIEWESSDTGIVAELLVPAGSQIPVNTVVALFTSKPGEDIGPAKAKATQANAKLLASQSGPAPAQNAAPTPAPAPAPAPGGTSAAPQAKPMAPAPSAGALPRGMRVSPVAAKLAVALSVDLRAVRGSGPDGRIIRRDVEEAGRSGSARLDKSAASGSAAPRVRLTVARPDAASFKDVPFTQMRQVIGKRLLDASTQIPHFTVSDAVNASALHALREQLNLVDGLKITINSLVVRATALALRQHPRLNANYLGNSVRQFDSADICVAVAIPDGLITPIIPKAHTKSVRQIGEEMVVLAKKATDGKLKPEEFQGGSFTISNLGMYGISSFTAIINPPQVAILSVAGVRDEPVVRDGLVVPGKVMRLSVSADHRCVDGADAAAFIKSLRELLENPAALLI